MKSGKLLGPDLVLKTKIHIKRTETCTVPEFRNETATMIRNTPHTSTTNAEITSAQKKSTHKHKRQRKTYFLIIHFPNGVANKNSPNGPNPVDVSMLPPTCFKAEPDEPKTKPSKASNGNVKLHTRLHRARKIVSKTITKNNHKIRQ